MFHCLVHICNKKHTFTYVSCLGEILSLVYTCFESVERDIVDLFTQGALTAAFDNPLPIMIRCYVCRRLFEYGNQYDMCTLTYEMSRDLKQTLETSKK